MRAVFKYVLALKAGHAAELSPPIPQGAQLLRIGEQRGAITAWAIVDQAKPIVIRKLNIFGTGHKMPDEGGEGFFVDTVQLSSGLVFHVFDAGERLAEEWELG